MNKVKHVTASYARNYAGLGMYNRHICGIHGCTKNADYVAEFNDGDSKYVCTKHSALRTSIKGIQLKASELVS